MSGKCSFVGDAPSYNQTFNSLDWKSAPEEKRYVYVEDLLARKTLEGKSKSEVIDLLGSPNPHSQSPDSIGYIFRLGGYGFNKVHFLIITIGENGVVDGVKISGD